MALGDTGKRIQKLKEANAVLSNQVGYTAIFIM